MAEVRVGENETFESALRRFNKKIQQSGILAEARRREHYEKPSVKRKRKEAKRKKKRRRRPLSGTPAAELLRPTGAQGRPRGSQEPVSPSRSSPIRYHARCAALIRCAATAGWPPMPLTTSRSATSSRSPTTSSWVS